MKTLFLWYALLFPLVAFTDPPKEEKAVLQEVFRIWDQAPHNAFTDLIRFKDAWFCVFREGRGHVSPDGALRVITSTDGKKWRSAALMKSDTADLRDAKITLTPEGSLMLSGAGALHPPSVVRHKSMVWFSKDGLTWSKGKEVGEKNLWLWRVTWHKKKAYGMAYHTQGEPFVRLYESADGKEYQTLVDKVFRNGYPNEATLIFLEDDTCLCLLRREAKNDNSAQLGRAKPPYTVWTWNDLGVRLGGPNMIRLPKGRLIVGGRLYDKKVRSALLELDPEKGTLKEILTLPSGGDTSYPGFCWHENLLWVSYYSSHEGKTSIYLVKVAL